MEAGLGSSYLESLNLRLTQLEGELKGKLDTHKIILDNLNQNFTDMKQGLALRVEQDGKDIAILKHELNLKVELDGKDIAILKEASKVFVCQKDFTPIKEAVKELREDKKLAFTIGISGLLHVWEIMMMSVFRK